MNSKWLFVHGGWGGSWQWEPLIDKLEKEGHITFAPEMPGMGQADGGKKDLNDFIEVCLSIMKSEAKKVNVVAFSFGGMTATALVGLLSEKIEKLIYIDAFVPEMGQAFTHIAGEKITRQIVAYSDVMGEENMIPPFFETDERYRNHPLPSLFSEVQYEEEKLNELNPLYIECTDKDPEWTFTPLLERTANSIRNRSWRIKSLNSDHMPMYSHTDELLELLLSVGE